MGAFYGDRDCPMTSKTPQREPAVLNSLGENA
jgi:hypothetical protein